jgi:hypothetical protein
MLNHHLYRHLLPVINATKLFQKPFLLTLRLTVRNENKCLFSFLNMFIHILFTSKNLKI